MLAEGFSKFFSAGMYTATTGAYYSLKIYWEFGFAYMCAPFIYFVTASILQPKFGSMDFGLYTIVEGAKAKFRTGQTRLLENAEAILAIGGRAI